MRLRRRYLPFVAVLGAALAVLPAAAGVETDPTVEAVNEGGVPPYGETHSWSPSHASIAAGGIVTFSNPTAVAHGVEWLSAVKPVCEEGPGKVPVGTKVTDSGKEWIGNCKFAQAGTYAFYCTVHHAAMSGTITVTIPGAPIATTAAASGVGQTEATLNGSVNPEGKETEYFFEWGTTSGYGQTTEKLSLGSSDKAAHSVSTKLKGLLAGTAYHYRLVAKSEAGTVPGLDQAFTTALPPGAPSATTGVATGLTKTEATLAGAVNPDGQATEYFFEWGTSAAYGHTTEKLPLVGEDHTEHAVSAALSELAPGTVYHFRLLAKNPSDSVPVAGADEMLTTASPPLPQSTTPTSPAPSATQPSAPPPPTSTAGTEPLGGGPLIAFGSSLRSIQHGTSVAGSLVVSAAAAGGRLEIDLLAKGASRRGAKRLSAVRVGRLVRGSVSAGRLSFVVKLDATAQRALRRLRRLALTLRITLTPTEGQAVTLKRSIEQRR